MEIAESREHRLHEESTKIKAALIKSPKTWITKKKTMLFLNKNQIKSQIKKLQQQEYYMMRINAKIVLIHSVIARSDKMNEYIYFMEN